MTPVPDGYEILHEGAHFSKVDRVNFIEGAKYEDQSDWKDTEWQGKRGCFWVKTFRIIIPKKS